MLSVHSADKVFAGSIPELYDTYLVPLIFQSYPTDLARRLAARRPVVKRTYVLKLASR